MRSHIDSNMRVTGQDWRLSLVVKHKGKNPEHAFLVVEGIDENQQTIHYRRYDFLPNRKGNKSQLANFTLEKPRGYVSINETYNHVKNHDAYFMSYIKANADDADYQQRYFWAIMMSDIKQSQGCRQISWRITQEQANKLQEIVWKEHDSPSKYRDAEKRIFFSASISQQGKNSYDWVRKMLCKMKNFEIYQDTRLRIQLDDFFTTTQAKTVQIPSLNDEESKNIRIAEKSHIAELYKITKKEQRERMHNSQPVKTAKNYAMSERLIKLDAHVNVYSNSESPLIAASKNNLEIVQLLVKKPANHKLKENLEEQSTMISDRNIVNTSIDTDVKENNSLPSITNLVLGGGSVKGLAYIAALQNLEKSGLHLPSIQRVAGTSTGAITAALLGLGYSLRSIRDELSRLNFKSLSDEETSTVNAYDAYGDKILTFREEVDQLLWIQTGIHNITFRELHKERMEKPKKKYKDVFILGVDFTTGLTTTQFNYLTTPDDIISDAVRISSCILPSSKPHARYCNIDGIRKIFQPEHLYVGGAVLDNCWVSIFDFAGFTDPSISEDAQAFWKPKHNPNTLGLRLLSENHFDSLQQVNHLRTIDIDNQDHDLIEEVPDTQETIESEEASPLLEEDHDITEYHAPKPEKPWSAWIGMFAVRMAYPAILAWDLLKLVANKLLGNYVGSQILPSQGIGTELKGRLNKEVQKVLSEISDDTNGKLIARRLRIVTYDNAKLDTLEFINAANAQKAKSKQRTIINFFGNCEYYEDKLAEMMTDADRLSCNVVGFNLRGVSKSTGSPNSKDDLVTDGIAQVQRLLDDGIEPENIILKGHSLGAGIATLIAKHFHDSDKKINIFNGRSFSSLTDVAVGHLRLKDSTGYNESVGGKILGWIAKPFIAFGLALIKWEINAVDAYKEILSKHKEYMVVRSSKADRKDKFVADDIVIPHYASLHNALKSTRRKQKNLLLKAQAVNNALRVDPLLHEEISKANSMYVNMKEKMKERKVIVAGQQFTDGHTVGMESLQARYQDKPANELFGAFFHRTSSKHRGKQAAVISQAQSHHARRKH